MPMLYAAFWQAIAFVSIFPCIVQAEGNDFLKYQEPKSQTSLLGSVDSMLYMITVFAIILGLAFVSARYFGRKFAPRPSGLNGDSVMSSLSLGPNRGVYLVQFAGRLLVLGVSEQKIELLADMTDAPNASELKSSYINGAQSSVAPQFSAVFGAQVSSLRQMSAKFPRAFGQYGEDIVKSDHDREMR